MLLLSYLFQDLQTSEYCSVDCSLCGSKLQIHISRPVLHHRRNLQGNIDLGCFFLCNTFIWTGLVCKSNPSQEMMLLMTLLWLRTLPLKMLEFAALHNYQRMTMGTTLILRDLLLHRIKHDSIVSCALYL